VVEFENRAEICKRMLRCVELKYDIRNQLSTLYYKVCFQFQFTALHQGGAYTNAPYLYPVFNAYAVKVYSIVHSFLYHKVCFWSGRARRRRHCSPRHPTYLTPQFISYLATYDAANNIC
jgi:hypothetical protein